MRIIQLDMVLIHKESLGDDGQTLIASDLPVRFYDRRNAVHEGDLLCEEFQLGSDGVKLQLQAFNDGDKDILVHR